MSYDVIPYLGVLLRAAVTTLWISWVALLLGAVVGGLVGMARTARWRLLRLAALIYTETFRSIPILILMFFCYFGLPLLTGHDLSPFAAATLALMLEASALMSEVVRAGIESVGHGQWQAAYASGMRYWSAMRHVIGPQAIRVVLPPSVGVYIATLKDSSLASIIGYLELTKTGLLVRDSTGDSFLVFLIVSVLYFIINYAISLAGGLLERKFSFAHH
ncbi:MAG: amino acid ABC transporter permease [Rhodospirillaceae bacterium]|nr:amino acid ABC transporter permease [Rhodospirillaceae bacterium]